MSFPHPLLGEPLPVREKFHESELRTATVLTSESSSTGTFTLAPQSAGLLKRSLELPFSSTKKPHHKLLFYNTQPVERLPSPSVSMNSSANNSVDRLAMPPPSPPSSKKRFSLSRLTTGKNLPKLSLSNSLNRLLLRGVRETKDNNNLDVASTVLSRTPKRKPPSDGPYKTLQDARMPQNGLSLHKPSLDGPYGSGASAYSVSRTSLSSDMSMATEATGATGATGDSQYLEVLSAPFWKYHVLKLGKDMYLTTNPGLEHVYCRNGPGYYVETIYADKSKKPNVSYGFTLVFKDIQCVDLTKPLMLVTKKPTLEGGHFTVSIPRPSSSGPSWNASGLLLKQSGNFNGLLIPKKIPHTYLPDPSEVFVNYEFKDFNNVKWNVGPIPRVRPRRANRISHRISASSMHADFARNSEIKYVGKGNVYFHQNYLDDQDCHNPLNVVYREMSGDPQRIYKHEMGAFPPVLGMFRPYEKSKRKRLVNAIKRKSKLDSLRNSAGIFNRSLEMIGSNRVDNDVSGGSVKRYYKGGDGLYYLGNPQDDTPDDNKLGWVTVYEDQKLFLASKNKGMFDIVLGLTLAVGFERSVTTSR